MGPLVRWYGSGIANTTGGLFTQPSTLTSQLSAPAGSRTGVIITPAMDTRTADLIIGATAHDGVGSLSASTGRESAIFTTTLGGGDVYTTIFQVLVDPDLGNGGWLRLLYKFAPGTDIAWSSTETGTDVYSAIGAIAFRGMLQSSAVIDRIVTASGGTSVARTSWNAGNLTPQRNGCMVVAALILNANFGSTNIAIDSGFTLLGSVNPNPSPPAALADQHHGLALATRWLPTITTVNPTWTWTTGTFAAAGLVALRAAS